MKLMHLKFSMSLRVIGNVIYDTHVLYTRSQFRKLERRPTQRGRDYAPRFTSSFSGTSVSLLLSPPRIPELRTCLRHANVTYASRVCECVRASYFLHESAPHAFLYLSPATLLASVPFHTHPHARTYVHTYTRMFAEWTIDYAFASITRLRCTLSFRPISRPVPFAPDSSIEIKGEFEMRALVKNVNASAR